MPWFTVREPLGLQVPGNPLRPRTVCAVVADEEVFHRRGEYNACRRTESGPAGFSAAPSGRVLAEETSSTLPVLFRGRITLKVARIPIRVPRITILAAQFENKA